MLGLGVIRKDCIKSLTLYQELALDGDTPSMNQLGSSLFEGECSDPKKEMAEQFILSNNDGSSYFHYGMGILYLYGTNSTNQDFSKAYTNLRTSALLGNFQACQVLISLYAYGVGVEKNVSTSDLLFNVVNKMADDGLDGSFYTDEIREILTQNP